MAYNLRAMAEYAQDPRTAGRHYAGWLIWSVEQLAAPVPPKPNRAWVRLRLLAERVPVIGESLAQRTKGFFLQDPGILERLEDYLAPEGDEAALAAGIIAALESIAPRVAEFEIATPEVEAWLTARRAA